MKSNFKIGDWGSACEINFVYNYIQLYVKQTHGSWGIRGLLVCVPNSIRVLRGAFARLQVPSYLLLYNRAKYVQISIIYVAQKNKQKIAL